MGVAEPATITSESSDGWDEERMRSGHWLMSVLWVCWIALILLDGWVTMGHRKGTWLVKKSVPLIPVGSLLDQLKEENW